MALGGGSNVFYGSPYYDIRGQTSGSYATSCAGQYAFTGADTVAFRDNYHNQALSGSLIGMAQSRAYQQQQAREQQIGAMAFEQQQALVQRQYHAQKQYEREQQHLNQRQKDILLAEMHEIERQKALLREQERQLYNARQEFERAKAAPPPPPPKPKVEAPPYVPVPWVSPLGFGLVKPKWRFDWPWKQWKKSRS